MEGAVTRTPRTTHITSMQQHVQAMALMVAFGLLGIALTGGHVLEGAMAGTLVFLVYRLGLVRAVLCSAHRRGVRLVRDGDLQAALMAFEESGRRWQRHAWLDRRRGWLLGSTSRWPFHARALYNQGYCLSQLGRTQQALTVLDALRRQHGEMGLARELQGSIESVMAAATGDWEPVLGEVESPVNAR